MGWIHHKATNRYITAWWLITPRGTDVTPGWVMEFHDRDGYYITLYKAAYEPAAGPFETLEAAKVAYVLMFGGEV